jgi:hypothetical protein
MTMPMTGRSSFGNAAGSLAGKGIKGYNKGEMANFTPEQMQLFQSLFSNIGGDSFVGKLASGDQSQFEQLEAPALRQFGALQGNIASRFSGMGSGARRSSGFQNTMSSAASDFAQQLQAQRLGLQQQAIRDLMGMGSQLLGQRPYEQFLVKKEMPFWKQLALTGSQAGAEALGGMAGKAMFM